MLADLQLQLPRPTFDTWLKPTAGVAFQGDRFIVVAPTPFAVEWLERRMFHALQSTLERAAGRGLQLQLQTLEAHNGDDAPVGDDDQGNPPGPDHETPDHEPGVKPVSEGKDARVAGASVRYAAIRYRNAAKAARKRGESPLRDEVARARAGLLLSAAAAWHPLWLKWRMHPWGRRTCRMHPWGRASLGETHLPDAPIPPAQTRLGEVFQAAKRFGFALSQGNQSHTLAGEMLKAAERLRRKDYTSIPWRKTPATEEATAPAE